MSDSDEAEFYDAEDVTPLRNIDLISRPSRCSLLKTTGKDLTFSSIEKEEKLLREEQQRIEDRNKYEQEEIQRRLEALHIQKCEEKEKQELVQRAAENAERHAKLEDMRRFMSEDMTPVHSPDLKSAKPKLLDFPESQTAADRDLEEKLQALSFEIQSSGQCAPRPVTTQDNATVYNINAIPSSANSSFLSFVNESNYREIMSRSGQNQTNSSKIGQRYSRASSLNSNMDKLEQYVYRSSSREFTDASTAQSKSSSLPVQLSTFSPITAQPVVYQEPDIIQSTKSLPRQQPVTSTPKVQQTSTQRNTTTPEPVAPPRKKKSTRSHDSLYSNSEQGWLGWRESSLSDTSESMVTDYLPSLDLSQAIQGNCHVTALDDVAAKGLEDSSHDIQDDDDSQSEVSDKPDVTGRGGSTDEIHDADNLHLRSLKLAHVKSKTLATDHIARHDKPPAAKLLSDKEILEQVRLVNLDTGEELPLSQAEDKLPKSINPLALHIMKRTNEYCSESSLQKKDVLEKASSEQGQTVKTINFPKKKGKKIKKFLSKSVRRIKSELKSVKDDMLHGDKSSSDDDELVDGRRMIKIKASHSHKGPYDFDLLVPVQNLTEDSNAAVWTMKFSHCGKLLVTGGQDNIMRVWVLKAFYSFFDGMRQRYSEASSTSQHNSTATSMEDGDSHAPFVSQPFCVYRGHTADLLDVSWSRNYFLLSSSMDKTVRLWHVSRSECLCCFQHIDFVTAIAFHPKDDRYFLSGSLDGKLRLWSIPEKKVALWNEVSGQSKLITAANFCSDGKIAVGTYDGRCVLYTADHLDYHTQIHVRSSRGKNAKGGKITGVEPFPGENKILVTSNDSRIRLYDLRDKTLTCKYKGTMNSSSRIKAVFNSDGRFIICGSEDGCMYIWKTQHDFYKFYSVRRDRNDFWEAVKAHMSVVTVAIFAPSPGLIIHPQFQYMDSDDKENSSGVRGEVIISADITGSIKVFINKFKPGSG